MTAGDARPALSVLMPVYNESDTIARILVAVARALPGVDKEVVIVDDGSTDGTRAWLQQTFAGSDAARLAERTEVKFLLHDRNRGKGAAVRTAMARLRGRGDRHPGCRPRIRSGRLGRRCMG